MTKNRTGTRAQLTSSKRKRKRFIPSLVLRFTLTLVLLGGTTALCWTALSDIGRPYVIGAQQSGEIAQKSQALSQIDSDNARITQQCAYLNRPDGIENEARLKGYLKPGEQSLIIASPAESGQQ